MDWNFYSKRRNVTLSSFLKGSNSLEEALLLFENRNIVPPLEEIKNHFASIAASAAAEDEKVVSVLTEDKILQIEETAFKLDSDSGSSSKKKTSKSVLKSSADVSEG